MPQLERTFHIAKPFGMDLGNITLTVTALAPGGQVALSYARVVLQDQYMNIYLFASFNILLVPL